MLIAFTVSVSDIVTAIKFISGPERWAQVKGFNYTLPEEHGTLFDGPKISKRTALPRKVTLTPRVPHIAGSKSMKIRYGPYTVPGVVVYVAKFSVVMT